MPEVRVQDEQGNIHVFPDGSTPEMISQAMGLKPAEPPKEGFVSALGSDLKGMAKSVPDMAARVFAPGYQQYKDSQNLSEQLKSVKETGQTPQQFAATQRRTQGYGPVYSNVTAPLAEGIGVNVGGMEQAAASGDTAGVLGHAAAVPTAAVITAGLGKVAPRLTEFPSKYEAMKTAPQMLTMEQMKQMSPREVSGLEDIYRASAPTGKNPGFRDNLNAALPDLKKVAAAIDLSESKGGIISPDMRVRATVKAINGQLDNMYQTERVAQIQRYAGTPVEMKLGADARRGLEYLANNAGEAGTQQLAASALKRGTLPIEQADVLAQAANKYLKTYEKLPSEGKLQVEATNPKIGGLKELDRALGNSLNNTLTGKGEVGLRGYERRYAGLSAVRDALQDRMNAAELDQPGAVKGAIRLASTVMKGKSGLLSASQASVADITAGKALQSGFGKLSSGPKR